MVRSTLHLMKRYVPGLDHLVGLYRLKRAKKNFVGSADYWDSRYRSGDNSGPGSYGALAQYKAEFLNAFVRDHQIRSVIEFGCGDGHQLGLAQYPEYIGFDVSQAAIDRCRDIYSGDTTKSFYLYEADKFGDEQHRVIGDLTMSLDVVYHLVEDTVFEAHIQHLFQSSCRYVIIYSSNTNDQIANQLPHVRHRKFTDYVEHAVQGWALIDVIRNPHAFDGDFGKSSLAEFFVYEWVGLES